MNSEAEKLRCNVYNINSDTERLIIYSRKKEVYHKTL